MTKLKNFTFLFIFSLFAVQGFGQFQTDPVAASACEGGSATFQVFYNDLDGGGVNFQWDVGGTTMAGTSTNIFGNFWQVDLTISSAAIGLDGSAVKAQETISTDETATATLSVNSNPTAGAIANITTCVGQNAAFTSVVSGGTAPYDYTWTRYTGAATDDYSTTADGTLGSVTAAMNNSNIGLVVEDDNGCTASTVATATTLIVDEAPSITAQPAATDAFCSGGNVVLTVAANNASTYQWSNSSGAIGGANSASYTATAAETYTVSVGNTGCTSSAGAVTSNNSVVSESPTLAITAQPSGGTVTTGGNQSFSVTVTAGSSRSVIWTLDGETLSDPAVGDMGSDGSTSAGTSVRIASEVDNTNNNVSFG